MSEDLTILTIRLKSLPDSPGVYLMKNIEGDVIYVGKAKNLKKRISQYFSNKKTDIKTAHLVSKIKSFEIIVVNNEVEAFLLENNLIKNYKPKYNINLKDDKTYPYLKIAKNNLNSAYTYKLNNLNNLSNKNNKNNKNNLNDSNNKNNLNNKNHKNVLDNKKIQPKPAPSDFPYLTKTRTYDKNSGEYFGPYSNVKAVTDFIKMINKIFKIRTCNDTKFKLFASKNKPCVYYQINRCFAPCCGYITAEDYGNIIREIKMLLQGKNNQIIKDLKNMMNTYVKEQNFEAAIKIRDKIDSLHIISVSQSTVISGGKNIDAVGCYSKNNASVIDLIMIRNGKMIDSKNYYFKNVYLTDEELISSFIDQYYVSKSSGKNINLIPDEILLPFAINSENRNILIEFFKKTLGKKLKLNIPNNEKNKNLVMIASNNAKNNFYDNNNSSEYDRNNNEHNEKLLESLKQYLNLKKIPKIIECFDISNISGTYPVASKAVFKDGLKETSLYRKYKIRSKNTPDDYAMMYEVLTRRFRNAVNGSDPLPDLIIADGGKGQLNVFTEVKKEFKNYISETLMPNIISIAKVKENCNNNHDKKNADFIADGISKKNFTDKIYIPNRKNEVNMPSNLILFLMSVRDEAHRFAVTFHSSLKRKSVVTSELLNIKGIGASSYKKLIDSFGDVNNIKHLQVEELSKCVSSKIAKIIYEHFNPSV